MSPNVTPVHVLAFSNGGNNFWWISKTMAQRRGNHSFFCFLNSSCKLRFRLSHQTLCLCRFQRFPGMLAAWRWFSFFFDVCLLFRMLWDLWFKRVHQTLCLCRFQRFPERRGKRTFGFLRAPRGHLCEAMFTKCYACAGFSVSQTSGPQVQSNPKGYLYGYPRIRSYLSIYLSNLI